MRPQFLLASSQRGMWLDPRTKLYLLVVFSVVMIDGQTDGISLYLKPVLALIPFLLLLSGRRGKAGIAYLTIFWISWIVNLYLVPLMSGIALLLVALLAQLGTRWFASAMMGYYLLSTTKVSEFVQAMQKMHLPENFIIPFSVMFRFFPTVCEEADSIGKAMRMRGITSRNFLKNPMAMLEYRLVPLMMSIVTIGNDLSAAAITRGLGSGRKRTGVCRIGVGPADWLLILPTTAALVLFLIFQGGAG